MLTAEERTQIIQALENWADSAPDEPMFGFIGGRDFKTPLDLVKAIKQDSPDGMAVMECIEHGVRRNGLNDTIKRLQSGTQNHGKLRSC